MLTDLWSGLWFVGALRTLQTRDNPIFLVLQPNFLGATGHSVTGGLSPAAGRGRNNPYPSRMPRRNNVNKLKSARAKPGGFCLYYIRVRAGKRGRPRCRHVNQLRAR